MTQPANRRLATEAHVATVAATKVNSGTYTAGLATKQDTATLDAAVAPLVDNAASATATRLRAASGTYTGNRVWTGSHDFTAATVTGVSGGGSAVVPFDVTEGGLLHAILASRELGPVRVVFTGSSTAEDWENEPVDRYVNRLAAMMQAAYPSDLPAEAPVVSLAIGAAAPSTTAGIHVYNGAKGGTTSENYLGSGRRENLITLQPRVVFHMIGANNWSSNYNPATYKTDIQAVIADLNANITGPVVHVLLHSYPMQNLVSPTYQWSDYGDKLREIAATDPAHIYFIDLSGPFLAAGIASGDPLELLGVDNVHTTDAGQALIGALIARALDLPTPPRTAGGGGSGVTIPRVPANQWFFTAAPQGGGTSTTLGVGMLRVVPWVVETTQTIDQVYAEIATVGEAGSKLRLGIYADNGSLYPGNLVLDGGQIAGDTTTAQPVTITPLTLAPGIYWVGGAVQTVTTTQPSVRTTSTAWAPPIPVPLGAIFAPGVAAATAGYAATGVTGALPATFPAGAGATDRAPRLAARGA